MDAEEKEHEDVGECGAEEASLPESGLGRKECEGAGRSSRGGLSRSSESRRLSFVEGVEEEEDAVNTLLLFSGVSCIEDAESMCVAVESDFASVGVEGKEDEVEKAVQDDDDDVDEDDDAAAKVTDGGSVGILNGAFSDEEGQEDAEENAEGADVLLVLLLLLLLLLLVLLVPWDGLTPRPATLARMWREEGRRPLDVAVEPSEAGEEAGVGPLDEAKGRGPIGLMFPRVADVMRACPEVNVWADTADDDDDVASDIM